MSTPTIVNLEARRRGRRALTRTSYLEQWAARYFKAQQRIERDRLKKGLAKHRAHRLALTSTPPKNPAA